MHFADFSVDKFLAGIQGPRALQCLPVEYDRDRKPLRLFGQARGDLAGVGVETAQPDRRHPAPAAVANGFGGEENATFQTIIVAFGIRPLHVSRTAAADIALEARLSRTAHPRGYLDRLERQDVRLGHGHAPALAFHLQVLTEKKRRKEAQPKRHLVFYRFSVPTGLGEGEQGLVVRLSILFDGQFSS